MAANPVINTLTDPVLLDGLFSSLQSHLEAQLAWISTAYGKAEKRIKRLKDGRVIIYPAVYANTRDYVSVFPDSHLGSFTYFEVQDGYQVEITRRHNYLIEAEIGLIVWFDFREVFPTDWEQRTTQNVIEEVLNSFYLFSDANLKRFEINQIWEQAENIYSRYTRTEIENQFLMRPYGGFRIDIDLSYLAPCDPNKLEGVNYWQVENDNIVQP